MCRNVQSCRRVRGAGRPIVAGALELEAPPAAVLVRGKIPFLKGREPPRRIIRMAPEMKWKAAAGGIFLARGKRVRANFDGLVKSLLEVTPAKAGVQNILK